MCRDRIAGGLLCVMATFVPVMAHAAGIDGTGSMPLCPAGGDIKSKPALVTGGAEAGGLKLKVKSIGACTGGTGDGSTVVSFKAKAAGTTATNDCTSFGGTSSGDLALTFKWKVAKGSPKLNPSTATFSLAPGAVASNGSQTFDLGGTISAGSFVGTQVTAHIESDELAATLLAACGDKGVKKIVYGGDDGATDSCVNGPNLAAAITKQITSLDSNDVPHLEVEILTVTTSPFQTLNPDFSTATPGIYLESVSSNCTLDNGHYRCRHTAFYASTGACQWDGNYSLDVSYACSPTNTCDLCNGGATIPFSLDSENFCSGSTEPCVVDLSCSESVANGSAGGVPCCSDTYNPFLACLDANCAVPCAAVRSGDGGVNSGSPCEACVLSSCFGSYASCFTDMSDCN